MKATFGGGCFWCTEVIFQNTEGVTSVLPGYMGGHVDKPTYEQVCTGTTDHVEVVELEYDEELVNYEDLLKIFFKTHNPTTLNRQGNDVGTQYRSVVFYHNEEQEILAQNFIDELENEDVYEDAIVTTVEPAVTFWLAEDYHHNYFNDHPENPFCSVVIAPKLQKFLKEFKA
ncbi:MULTISPECIES: peptide-methionine (S)-S-oxide reductase MsrA [Sphingobacterium]|jgi:peptide-methionine (S)-S-oxide reductase|uniref:Peptide-methionine (S)-S-oxide reductase MsrA n=4 Tax=Sphingobacterium TaxID=28453 RepID=A0ACD5CBR3_9SPHI|nr:MULTISPECIES: peptide-methionine (S)-S-oxide reductase MsrA [Sphingobacterium]HAL53596.1 peptide-methionine (S)-S-oxide reductase [Sphingobacterium sp.]MCS4167871.1 peptide-methionine (S)-S-oxide reductase [Sphingobacterium sp. BIGb0116]QMV68550.1 peptide-methionine (S)-S-oxide reductase MsrA [Sphingobacterium paramultivorum]QQT32191.1 peptide-methionine (S)-S-oxide reductase MsrA [Sphingobacterium multivorum]QQT51889.1 peptide-methionine (S)-S-oxide reductase MsrA [Sphingobacterium multivo